MSIYMYNDKGNKHVLNGKLCHHSDITTVTLYNIVSGADTRRCQTMPWHRWAEIWHRSAEGEFSGKTLKFAAVACITLAHANMA